MPRITHLLFQLNVYILNMLIMIGCGFITKLLYNNFLATVFIIFVI